MSHNSHGTKVDLGNEAPERRERAGIVADDSLAAESYRSDGEFSKNVGVKPEHFDKDKNSHSGPKAAQEGNGGAAPSYNIREENLDLLDNRDGLKRALRSEPGSEDDPSRLAEQQMKARNEAIPGTAAPVRDTEGGNTFEELDRKKSA